MVVGDSSSVVDRPAVQLADTLFLVRPLLFQRASLLDFHQRRLSPKDGPSGFAGLALIRS
jgi:hypothetical protein